MNDAGPVPRRAGFDGGKISVVHAKDLNVIGGFDGVIAPDQYPEQQIEKPCNEKCRESLIKDAAQVAEPCYGATDDENHKPYDASARFGFGTLDKKQSEADGDGEGKGVIFGHRKCCQNC